MMRRALCVLAAAAATVLVSSDVLAQPTHYLATQATHREIWRGQTAGSQAGFHLDRGDVSDGDTRRDLIVGAPEWNSQTGRVYVLFAGPIFNGEQMLANAPVLITGGAAGDRFGASTAAGYVTAQELTLPMPQRDLVVGAPGANSGAGAVYMYLRGLVNGADRSAADANLTITGAPAGAQMGFALATGDLTGDGYREIIIGAPGTSAVYVILGGDQLGTTVTSINLAAPADADKFFRIQGPSGHGVGGSLAAGDLSGHRVVPGVATYDLAIGAPQADGNKGGVHVIFGRAGNTFGTLLNLSTQADSYFAGVDAADAAGSSLSIEPIDGDTISDLVISAPNGDGPGNSRNQAGEVYVIWGVSNLGSRLLSGSDVIIYGGGENHRLGTDIATGNVNRTGADDIVMVAPGASPGGELLAVNGRPRSEFSAVHDLGAIAPDRRVVGDPAAGVIQATAVVDMTGDGADDLVAGLPMAGEGLVYISFSVLPPTRAPRVTDFNGDGSADLALFNRFTGTWMIKDQSNTIFGLRGDIPVPGDYNGDGTTDFGVFRPSTGMWIIKDQFEVQFGERGDVPLPADYNGDGRMDVAVYRPSTGQWFIRDQFVATFGGRGFVPVPADYNGDGATDVAVFERATATWFVRNYFALQYGEAGDVPVPADYDGNGAAEVAVYRPATSTWLIRHQAPIQFGNPGDRPVPRDFNGNGTADIAVFRPSNNTWYIRNQTTTQFGSGGAMPIPFGMLLPLAAGDYNGDGIADISVFRPSSGTWYVRDRFSVGFGQSGDRPMPADYNGDGVVDVAVYRPSTGQWLVRNLFTIGFGDGNDIPVPGDYNGDGVADIAVYRPATGTWYVRGQFTVQYGDNGDIPVPGDYNFDGITDIAVYRPSTGAWYIRAIATVFYGDSGDVPVAADYNGDGATDVAVYRPSTGHWFIRNVSTVVWGDASDVPVFADYDGDGRADVAVYRPSTGMWYVRNLMSVPWGDTSDIPVVRIGGY